MISEPDSKICPDILNVNINKIQLVEFNEMYSVDIPVSLWSCEVTHKWQDSVFLFAFSNVLNYWLNNQMINFVLINFVLINQTKNIG